MRGTDLARTMAMPVTTSRYLRLFAVCIVLGLAACGTARPRIAVPNPLQRLEGSQVGRFGAPSAADVLDAEGLFVAGNFGRALTIATRMHRALIAQQVRHEIRCNRDSGAGTRLRIAYGRTLRAQERHAVRRMLAAVLRSEQDGNHAGSAGVFNWAAAQRRTDSATSAQRDAAGGSLPPGSPTAP